MVPYGDDITEAIPYTLSNPAGATNYSPTGEAYDVAISGQPFFLQSSDDTPYRRVTAQYRKQQYDQTREAGEQSLTGWWFRSQSSFHYGMGIKYFEPAQDESLRFQYKESKGVNVWEKGQVTLINDVDPVHTSTGALKSNNRPNQHMRSIRWIQNGNTYEGVLFHDEYDIDKIFPTITATITNKELTSNVATLTAANHGFAVGFEVDISGVDATFNGTYTITAVTTNTFSYARTASNVASQAATGTASSELEHFVDYNSGTDYPVYAMTDDGVYCYWITKIVDAGVDKTAMYKRPLDSSSAATQMWKSSSVVVSDACMEFTKERIVATINNAVYEYSTTASAIGTPVYTHPVDDFNYTSISSSGAAIYCAGFSGSQSNIQKFILASNGTMPTLLSAITAAEMPSGELIYKIYYYLGYMAIGTTKGVRIAAVSDDGSLAYGPLIFESEQAVYDFAARDSYLWCATNVDGSPGTTRIDLGTSLGTLLFPYAWDTYYYPVDANSRVTGHVTTACAFINGTDRLAFCTNKVGVTNGEVYIETAPGGRLVWQGYLQTGFIRYNTLELKRFKFLLPQFDTTNGSVQLSAVGEDDTEYGLGLFSQGDTVGEVAVNYPSTPQQYLAFKFIIKEGDDDTKSPVFTGYQVKALPAVPRQRLIQYPLICFDHETDRFGVQVGYEGSAWQRMEQLEAIENNGDTIRIEDYRTGESYVGLIEELDFINRTPTDKRFSGFGGVLLVTIRSV